MRLAGISCLSCFAFLATSKITSETYTHSFYFPGTKQQFVYKQQARHLRIWDVRGGGHPLQRQLKIPTTTFRIPHLRRTALPHLKCYFRPAVASRNLLPSSVFKGGLDDKEVELSSASPFGQYTCAETTCLASEISLGRVAGIAQR